MCRSRVLPDYGHVELTGQEHDRHHAEPGEGRPVAIGERGVPAEHAGVLRPAGHVTQEIPHPAEHAVGDEGSHGQKGEQLDQRLEGDGGDQPLVPPRGIEVAGAEHDPEDDQDHRRPERGVGVEGPARRRRENGGNLGVVEEDLEGLGDGLELERDVRGDADHHHEGHDPPEERGLSVAGAEEVGEGGDAVGLGDSHRLAQHEPPQERHQGGAEIDGQEADPGGDRPTDAPVEGPRGAVDGERERVDEGRVDHAPPVARPPVAGVGDGEQPQHVGQGDREHPPRRQHRRDRGEVAPGRPAHHMSHRRAPGPSAHCWPTHSSPSQGVRASTHTAAITASQIPNR